MESFVVTTGGGYWSKAKKEVRIIDIEIEDTDFGYDVI